MCRQREYIPGRKTFGDFRTDEEVKQSLQPLPPNLLALKGHQKAKVTVAYCALESLLRWGHTLEEMSEWPDGWILRQKNIGVKILPYFKDILQWRLRRNS